MHIEKHTKLKKYYTWYLSFVQHKIEKIPKICLIDGKESDWIGYDTCWRWYYTAQFHGY